MENKKQKIKSFTDLNVWQKGHQLLIARDIGCLSKENFNTLAEQTIVVSKLINRLIKKSKAIIHNS